MRAVICITRETAKEGKTREGLIGKALSSPQLETALVSFTYPQRPFISLPHLG